MNGRDRLAGRAMLALTVIAVLSLPVGVLVAYLGEDVGAVVTLAVGAVSGIVAIVIKDERN